MIARSFSRSNSYRSRSLTAWSRLGGDHMLFRGVPRALLLEKQLILLILTA